SGVVDGHLDVEREVVDGARQLAAALGRAEVGGDDLGPHAVFARELRGELAQAVLAARGEDHAVPPLGELARDRGADPRRRTRDERGTRFRWGRESHGYSF